LDVPRDPQQRPGSLTMARKPTLLREWRVSIIREKIQYLGRVVAPDKEAAIEKAMEEFRIEPARRFRVFAYSTRVAIGRDWCASSPRCAVTTSATLARIGADVGVHRDLVPFSISSATLFQMS
jgi:phosphomannomutase